MDWTKVDLSTAVLSSRPLWTLTDVFSLQRVLPEAEVTLHCFTQTFLNWDLFRTLLWTLTCLGLDKGGLDLQSSSPLDCFGPSLVLFFAPEAAVLLTLTHCCSSAWEALTNPSH